MRTRTLSPLKNLVKRHASGCIYFSVLCWFQAGIVPFLGFDNISKLVIDTLLYLISFRVQNKWVFKEEST